MAIYSLHVKTVSRSTGRSVVAAAAYRSAEKLADERLGVVWDFTRRSGVLHSEIYVPQDAPEWAADRAALWNAAERAEDKSTRRSTATTGRDIILALPHELTDEQRIAATRRFAAFLVERYGVAVDFAVHAADRHGDDRNYHAHLLMSTRRLGADGFGRKVRELDDFKTGPGEIEIIRQAWERIGNSALREAGLDIRIDSRSYEDQGIDREATVHLGPVASGMERAGQETDLGDRNRAAKARNAERDSLDRDRAALSAKIIDLAAERQRRAEAREFRSAVRTHDPARILEALTHRRPTFDRAALNRELAKEINDPKLRAALTDHVLAHASVVPLREHRDAAVSRYTTKEVLASEARLSDAAGELARSDEHAVAQGRVDRVLRRHAHLRPEQRDALHHATGPEGLTVIAGEAGTGKTATLAAVRDANEADGYRVIGMAWTNAVVQDLQRDGFRGSTIAAELWRLENGLSRWDERTVLIVDEAAMLSTRHLASVAEQARQAGAKLILAGDDKQLASIERGGMFGALKEWHGAAELHEVIRVSDRAQQQAFNFMHRGEFGRALDIFDRSGAIHWSDRQEQAREALVGKWALDTAMSPDRVRFVFAYTNADVDRLNADLREMQRAMGRLGADHMIDTAHGRLAFAAGDRVQFTATDKSRGLHNGAVGTVTAVQGEHLHIQLDGRKDGPIEVDSATFTGLRHGYAGTIYKGQGRTLDQTYLYHSQHWRAAPSYVALTRHRHEISLFVARETATDQRQLARQMARIDETRAASQFHVSDEPRSRPDLAGRRARAEEAAVRRRAAQGAGGLDQARAAAAAALREAREAAGDARQQDEERQRERERERGRSR